MGQRAGIVVFGLVAGLASALPAPAQGGSEPPFVPAAYRHAANAHDVPPVMLYALSLTESAVTLSHGQRPWPWTLNIRGKGVRYRTKAAACRALRSALETNRIVDVGLSQINVRWQPQLFGTDGRFADPCDGLDPYANLDAAAAILRRCYRRQQSSWTDAAGCYHRPAGGPPAARYRRAFSAHLTRLGNDGARIVRDSGSDDAQGGAEEATGTAPAVSAPETNSGHTERPARVTWINPDTEDDHGLD